MGLGALIMWASKPLPGHPWHKTFTDHAPDWFVAIFTLFLTFSTLALWSETKRLASDAKDSADDLVQMERPYLTAGGDFDKKMGFRLDVENHGKTAAFITGYDIRFAKLAELEEDKRQNKEPRPLEKNRFRHMDGISPTGARKYVFTHIPIEPSADVIYGAVYYRDPIHGKEHHSHFLLRIASSWDIPGHGITRLDRVKEVHEDYWSWDHRKASSQPSA
jgi:hypothetical protein